MPMDVLQQQIRRRAEADSIVASAPNVPSPDSSGGSSNQRLLQMLDEAWLARAAQDAGDRIAGSSPVPRSTVGNSGGISAPSRPPASQLARAGTFSGSVSNFFADSTEKGKDKKPKDTSGARK